MGCCVSREGGEGTGGGMRLEGDKGGSFNSTEEETVKEVVMSETTPARPACFVTRDNLYAKQRRVGAGGGGGGYGVGNVNDEASDAGSLCDNNVAVVGGRESGEYLKWEKSKSFSGEMMGRQRSGRRSPVVKSLEPSPVRRRRNEGGSGGGGGGRMRSGTSRESPQKVGVGERSGRRSRSPGMRSVEMVPGSRPGTGGVGRSPSGRRTPSRGRGSAAESSRRSEEGGGGGEGKWAQVDESLENPLVALECFIFL